MKTKNPFNTDPSRSVMRAWRLAIALIRRPHYPVLLCINSVLPPDDWTEDISVDIDDKQRLIRVNGNF